MTIAIINTIVIKVIRDLDEQINQETNYKESFGSNFKVI